MSAILWFFGGFMVLMWNFEYIIDCNVFQTTEIGGFFLLNTLILQNCFFGGQLRGHPIWTQMESGCPIRLLKPRADRPNY